ncbi:MAG TPA: M23 family metallopeptidase [Acidimicrobiales bacterium]|nr:M23 family metallopeptidase [Acidimicrobiales bacterium]
MWRTRWAVVGVVVLATACRATPVEDPTALRLTTTPPVRASAPAPTDPEAVVPTIPTTLAPTTVAPTTRPPTTRPPTTPLPTAAPTTQPLPRVVHEQAWTPFAAVVGSEVVLHHPASRVERVGFHESNHDGARGLDPLATAASPVTLEGRDRGTGARTSADVVVDPNSEIRSPVTGTVRRAGTYTLYCDNRDDYVVIEPDSRPGWEVKLLHINGVRVRAGERVVAGETVLAPRATVLPFESQVEEVTAKPPWPHVHIEVVDPTIPDRPSPSNC